MKTSTTTEGVPRCASTNTCSPQNRETASVWFLGTWAPSTRKAHAPPRARSHRASSCWSRCSSPRSSSLNFHVTLKQRDLWTPESLPKATLENKLEDEDRAPPTRGRTPQRGPPHGVPHPAAKAPRNNGLVSIIAAESAPRTSYNRALPSSGGRLLFGGSREQRCALHETRDCLG